MKRKELNKSFIMISNWKKTSVSMVHTNIFQRLRGQNILRNFFCHFYGFKKTYFVIIICYKNRRFQLYQPNIGIILM